MTKRLTLATIAALVFVSLTLGADWGRQATAAPRSQPSTASAQPPSPPQMQDMMRMHEQMMADMKAGNAKLEELVKQMNAAKGEAKIDATAAVVTELVRQHTAMAEHMGEMSQHMMGGRGMMKK